MALRGIRGAATVEENSREEIFSASQALVTEIFSRNKIALDDVGAIIFTSTPDLTAAFPTAGLRQLQGFNLVPLFDAQETFVEGSLPMCLRVLVLAELDKKPAEIHHVYLGGAKKLRPDLT